MTVSERLAAAASRLLARRVSRRDALSRVAVAGAAFAVAPARYLVRPGEWNGRVPVFTVAGCSGYRVDRTRARRAA